MALVKKGPFSWLFIAIKFKLSLVITFMAFYDCVRTLYKILNYLLIITVPSQAYIILAMPQGFLNVNFYEHFNGILKCGLNECPDSLLSSISSAERIANKK